MANKVEGAMPVSHLRGAFLGSLHDLPRCIKEEARKKRRPLTGLFFDVHEFLKT